LGVHIIQVLEHEQARVRPFEEVRTPLMEELRKQGISEKVQTQADQIRAALAKAPNSAAEVAKQFGADLVEMPDARLTDAIPTLGNTPEIADVLPSMKPGDVSQVMVLPGDRMAVAVVKGRTPARPAEFAEVQSQVRERMIAERAQRLSEEKAREAAERLQKGEDINAVAKSYKLDVTTSSDFGRNDSVEGLGPASYLEDAFTKPAGTIVGPTVIQGREVVAKVVSKTPADMTAYAAERSALVDQLKGKKATGRNELILDSILARLIDQGDVKVHPEQIQRVVASYRR
jgi:peptidyl-prolyl cis-trans isomerase D